MINKDSSFDYPAESEMQKDKDGNMFIAGGKDAQFKILAQEVY